MSTPSQKEIELLTAAYAEKLPERFKEIEQLWHNFKTNPTTDTVKTLHLKAHSLKGSSGIYGFMDVSKIAKNLETAVINLESDNNNLTIHREIDQLINALLQQPISISASQILNKAVVGRKADASQGKLIYFLDAKQELQSDLVPQLDSFGYQAQAFEQFSDLITAVEAKKPTAVCLNIDLLLQQPDAAITKVLKQQLSHIPLIFLSNTGHFKIRLRAAQLHGQAFLVKPYTVDEILTELDRISSLKIEDFRVIIIDDDVDSAKYFATILTAAGMSIKTINRADEIDSALHEFNPDIVLVDYYMPGCNGVELATILRQQRAYENLPIIFLSSEEDKLIQLQAMSVGADDFITKSIEPEHLVLTVSNKISRYRTLKTLAMKDNLTGVFSHTFVLQQLKVELKFATRIRIPLSVVLINVDGMRKINSTYGDASGDQVLKSLCMFMTNRLQGSFIMGRYAGDEFLIVLPDTTDETVVMRIDGLRDEFSKIQFISEHATFQASFSAGVSSYPQYKDAVALINAAHAEMQKTKQKIPS